jgi:linoleoyl-CoA desaturase
LGYHNRFQTDEKLLKRKLSYGEAKPKNTLDYFNYYQNNLCFYLDCLPIVIGITWWKVLLAFVMHYTAGLILSIIFQLAHEETTNPSPNELGEMDNTWAIHQLFTTTNFAPKTLL